ncbi:hypothetical protein AO381_1480 [Moraxella catarrhalis]|nr:hypothetical protein AO381_1480 [Moraxella catarrhalis]
MAVYHQKCYYAILFLMMKCEFFDNWKQNSHDGFSHLPPITYRQSL